MAQQTVRVRGLDHIVLEVADIERSLEWYCHGLGLAPVGVEEWRAGTLPFPSARIDAGTIIDFVAKSGRDKGRNLGHFCLVVEPLDPDALAASGELGAVTPPGQRSGARGSGTSVYVVDPDENVVELKWYGEDA